MSFRALMLSTAIATIAVAGSSLYAYRTPAIPTLEQMSDIGYWSERITALGDTKAYEEMVEFARAFPSTDMHIIAHTFGAALYQHAGIDGLLVCDSRPTYGCFHEVVKRAVEERGTDEIGTLADLCNRAASRAAFLCKHGIGHGLLLKNERSEEGLRTSLAECDAIMSPTEWEGCHSGAFMEYDFNMAQPGSLGVPRPLEHDSYFSPCDSIAEPYYLQCIRRRPYWWFVVLPKSSIPDKLSAMTTICGRLEVQSTEAFHACITGIGHQVAFVSDSDRDLREEYCAAASDSIEVNDTCLAAAEKAFEVLTR